MPVCWSWVRFRRLDASFFSLLTRYSNSVRDVSAVFWSSQGDWFVRLTTIFKCFSIRSILLSRLLLRLRFPFSSVCAAPWDFSPKLVTSISSIDIPARCFSPTFLSPCYFGGASGLFNPVYPSSALSSWIYGIMVFWNSAISLLTNSATAYTWAGCRIGYASIIALLSKSPRQNNCVRSETFKMHLRPTSAASWDTKLNLESSEFQSISSAFYCSPCLRCAMNWSDWIEVRTDGLQLL